MVVSTHSISTTSGILWLSAALLSFAIQDAVVKHLTQDYAVLQLLTIRLVLVLALVTLAMLLQRKPSMFFSSDWLLMGARGVVAFLAFGSYYLALIDMSLGTAATVLMTAPLFATALSVPILGERVGLHRWAAVLIGFAAVVFMLNPGSELFQPLTALPLMSALLYSLLPVTTRRISDAASTLTITWYTALFYTGMCVLVATLAYLLPATANSGELWTRIAQPWSAVSETAFALIAATALLFSLGAFCITKAYRVAHVSAIAPFEYGYLLWATLVGFIAFGDVPGLRSVFAGAVIVATGVYITVRERKAQER